MMHNETFSNPIVANSVDGFHMNSDLIYDGIKLNFISFSELEVYKSIYSLKANAVGYDDVSLKFVKLIISFILPTLTHIFNYIITTNIFSTAGKIAQIIPVAKNRTPLEPGEYRPISILPSLFI